jgi:hypothetical protein
MNNKAQRKAYIDILSRQIPDFKEERLVQLPIQVRSSKVDYSDPRFKDGFIEEKDRTFQFVISDESVDSHGTVFKADGWDLSLRAMGKQYVTYGHPWIGDLDPNVIIGIGNEEVKDKQLLSTFIAEPFGTNAKADAVVNKLHFGSLTDASVEAYIVDGYSGKVERGEDEDVFYFTNSILITYGIVMRGSNKNAMLRSIDRCQDSILQERHNKKHDRLIRSQNKLIRTLRGTYEEE